MEVTRHYWYALHDFLIRNGYSVAILNPIQIGQEEKQAIHKCKTDKYDALHIANLLRCGQYKATVVLGELAMTCRLLTRPWYRMVRQSSMTKQLVNSCLHPIWLEYEELFSNTFGKTSMELLQTTPTPKEVLGFDVDDLSERIWKVSRGRFGPAHTQRMLNSAKNSDRGN